VLEIPPILRRLKAQGDSLGQIAAKSGIPNTSLHRYLIAT
jgi:DNA-binding IclR family transcriptional regulator